MLDLGQLLQLAETPLQRFIKTEGFGIFTVLIQLVPLLLLWTAWAPKEKLNILLSQVVGAVEETTETAAVEAAAVS
jgi:hypothetical protein